jgi:cytochrome b561
MKPTGGKGRGVWILYFLFGSIPIFGLAGATNDETDQNLKWYFFVALPSTFLVALLC